MNRQIVITGAALVLTAIILGAFAAHGLTKMVSQDCLVIFEKGVKYQMYMGLGFLATGLASDKFSFNLKWFFRTGLTGVLIFSLLLYALTFKEQNESLEILGAVVPVGGVLMITSWGILIIGLLSRSEKK